MKWYSAVRVVCLGQRGQVLNTKYKHRIAILNYKDLLSATRNNDTLIDEAILCVTVSRGIGLRQGESQLY